MSTRKLAPYVLVAAFSLYSIFQPVLAQDKPPEKIGVKQGAPAGFEAFDAPHETSVDVNYGGLRMGSFRAVYTPKTILFAHPEEIIDKIPDIKHENVEGVLKALKGDLPTHSELICGRNPKEGCGKFVPDVAGVIFDEDHFRADLFLSPTVLATQDTHKDKILPPAPEVFSAVHSFNGGVTGGSVGRQNYSMVTGSTYAYGSGRVSLSGVASAKEKQINTATASLDRWGLENRAGYFDSHATQLIPQLPMLGVSVGTSLNTNLVLRDAAGTRLTVFLPERAYVSIIYRGVIYTTEFYEAGNQVLNTDTLPEGTYEITIRIRDTSGGQIEEKRFFAKNFSIPPEEQPIYYGQVGTIRDPQVKRFSLSAGQGSIASVGTVQRINETTGGVANLSFIKDQLFSEQGMFFLLPPDHQIRASTLLSSSMDFGFGISYLGYADNQKISVSSDARIIYSGKKSANIDSVDPVPNSSKQLSTTAAYQITDLANISLQALYSGSGNRQQQDKYSYGPQFKYDFWRGDNSILSLTTDTSKTDAGTVSSIYLRYSIRLGAWNYSADGSALKNGAGVSRNGNARVTWNDDKDPGNLTVVGAEISHDSTSNNHTVDLDHRGDYGNLRLLGTQSTNNMTNVSSNFYSGNFGFSVVDADHELSWGGNQQQTSGIVVKNTGNAADIPMKILVNHVEQSTFTTGKETTVFVTPYQTYNVQIKPTQSAPIDYDGTIKNVTLYPGNILPMVWVINRINVVLGHVVMPDGTPLAGARMEEAKNITVSDDDGMFQGELLELKKITFKRDVEEEHIVEKESDIFSILPTLRPHKKDVSKMSPEAQSEAMEELFGPDAVNPKNTSKPPEGGAAATTPATQAATAPAEQTATTPADATAPATPLASTENSSESVTETVHAQPTPPVAKKKLPAVHCEVILPDIQELNGVYIYPEPLVCNPISPEDEKKRAKAGEEKQALWMPYRNPMRVSQLFQPLLETHTEFASAIMNIQPKPVQENSPVTPLLGQPETAYAQAKKPAPPKVVTIAKKPALALPSFAKNTTVTPAAILVQLGAFRSEGEAQMAWQRVVSIVSEITDSRPVIAKVDLGTKGIFYRLRLANFSNTKDAKAFCDNLNTKGVSCIVARNDAAFRKKLIEEGEIELPVPLMTAESIESPMSPESSPDFTAPRLSPHAEESPAVQEIQPKQEAQVKAPEDKMPESQTTSANAVAVQLGAFRTESEAHSAMAELMRKFSELEQNKLVIIKVNLGERGVYYRLRVVNFSNSRAAKAFCRGLSSKGQACIVHIEDADDNDSDGMKRHADAPEPLQPRLGGPFISAEPEKN